MALFSFLTAPSPNATAAAGMQQYNQQGAGSIDPGKAPAMQGSSSPALGAALQQMMQRQQAQQQAQQGPQFNAGQQALAQGAQNGSVGPTIQNAALQQQMMQQQGAPQPGASPTQQPANWLSGLFGGGNGS